MTTKCQKCIVLGTSDQPYLFIFQVFEGFFLLVAPLLEVRSASSFEHATTFEMQDIEMQDMAQHLANFYEAFQLHLL